jgi:hypothetical protein
MRILFTIPHYYDAKGGGAYGSLAPDADARQSALRALIRDLHATFGRKQGMFRRKQGFSGRSIVPSNTLQAADIEVVICTTGGAHLVGALNLPDSLYRHWSTSAEPRFLGFECHHVLKSGLGQFDYYCYLEDDVSPQDALFFQKLNWFNRLAGDEAVLQPNRFEAATGQPVDKLYIDGTLNEREWSERWQDVSDRTVIESEAFGVPVVFRRVNNPHAGCFFLNARQMAHWAAQPTFLKREITFGGPLESAATYGVMRYFRVYKPARANAAFLEVRHLDNRFLGKRLKLRDGVASEDQA